MPLKSEKNACLFGSLFRNYLPLHPISQLKALIISVFINFIVISFTNRALIKFQKN